MAAHLAPPDAPCCHVGRVVIAGRPAREREPLAAARPLILGVRRGRHETGG